MSEKEREERETEAVAALVQRGRALGKRVTRATIGAALLVAVAFAGVVLGVGGVRDARFALRGAILLFFLALVAANRVGKVVIRRRVHACVDELAEEHRVSREALVEVARIFG